MKDYQVNNGWNNPHSYITTNQNSNGLLAVKGKYYHNGAEFVFTGTQQANGKYLFRGQASPISALDGRILQLHGRKKANRLETLENANPGFVSSHDGKRISELNITTQIHGNSLNIEEIKKLISHAVLRLYHEHADHIHRTQGEVARPETITPMVAAVKHVDDYLRINHHNVSEKTCQLYRNNILTTCAIMPHIPMFQYTQATIKSFLRSTPLSAHTLNLIRKFWLFCLSQKVCGGTLPFPPVEKRKKSAKSLQDSVTRPDELSFPMQDKLFEYTKSVHSGGDCGIALQIWGGFSAKVACSFNWADIIWDPNDTCYVRLIFHQDDKAGATHNYTRPLFPAGAQILRARYEELSAQYTPNELSTMPIVSVVSDPVQRMSSDSLVQYANTVLRTIGVSNDTFVSLHKDNPHTAVSRRLLLNSYSKNVVLRCNLVKEPGTANYLQGLSLQGNTSDDHYTCFSDNEAGAHLFAILSTIQPFAEFENPEITTVLSNNQVQYEVLPDNTRQRVGFVGNFVLNPGEELVITCPHGVEGNVQTRAFNPDGSLRRKSRSK